MKRIFKGLPFLLIIVGVMVVVFAGWQFFRTWPGLFDELADLLKPVSTPAQDQTALPTFTRLTELGGYDPHFGPEGESLYYLTASGMLGFIDSFRPGIEIQELVSLPASAEFVWDHNSERAIVGWQISLEGGVALDLFDGSTNTKQTIAENAWGAAWAPDDARITFFQMQDNQIGLWQADSDGKNPVLLTDLSAVEMPEYTAWSALVSRILVQAALGTAVYAVEDDVAIQTAWLPGAKEAAWSLDGWSLAYRIQGDEVDTLWTADLDGKNQRQVWEGVFSSTGWLPDGRLVFFTPGREGGASCWALAPGTGSQELLADSSVVVWKPVGSIAVSPRGDALAFQAQDQQIWLLNLGEDIEFGD